MIRTAAIAVPERALRIGAQYDVKMDGYFAGARQDFVSMLPADRNARVLEIGCGSGDTGALALAQGRAAHYTGVDISAKAAQKAAAVLSEVLIGDVERMPLPWRADSFDALILSEVLEHLVDPWAALDRLRPLLKAGGLALASSPNVSHYSIVANLARGRFELTDFGAMDRTHMRWFTPATYRGLFEGAGFTVEEIAPVTAFAPRTRLLSRLTVGRLDHLFMRQIRLRARKR
jgi:ubiquinone/menaquinone biosynthesis C-methylase UbiE